jgi:hypothetical protein
MFASFVKFSYIFCSMEGTAGQRKNCFFLVRQMIASAGLFRLIVAPSSICNR